MADESGGNGKASLSWQTIGNWTFAALISVLLYVWQGTMSDLKEEQGINDIQRDQIGRLATQLEERRQVQNDTNVRLERRLDEMNQKIDRLLER